VDEIQVCGIHASRKGRIAGVAVDGDFVRAGHVEVNTQIFRAINQQIQNDPARA
jgi:hypothetical protein